MARVVRAACLVLLALSVGVASAAPISVPATTGAAAPAAGERYIGPATGPHPDLPNEWSMIGPSLVLGVETALLPGTDDVIFHVGRNKNGVLSYKDYLAGFYDVPANKFTNVSATTNLFCSALLPTPDGKLVVLGGSGPSLTSGFLDGRRGLRLYDYAADPLVLPETVNMTWQRWYPTPTLRPDGTILINGGTTAGKEDGMAAKEYEIWDPKTPAKSPLPKFPVDERVLNTTEQNFFPFTFVLPTGDIWNMCEAEVRIFKADGTYVKAADGSNLKGPAITKIQTQYPKSGSAVMRALTYEDDYSSVEIFVFGGVKTEHKCTWGQPEAFELASRTAFSMKITWEKDGDGWTYNMGDWQEEDMLIARSGLDSVLLPNGDVVIMNGGQTGCPGGTQTGVRRNNYPAFWPVLFQPDRPEGERYTIMSASGLARMYHASTTLSRDGHIIVSGCDSCGAGPQMSQGIEVDFFNPSPTKNFEYRVERFKPPYALDDAHAPAITAVAGKVEDGDIVVAKYGDKLEVSWASKEAGGGLVNVTGVVLVAPSASTHGFNFNQRVVRLPFEVTDRAAAEGTLSATLPPNANLAPPQMYLLFLLNGKTYSRSRWVHLQAAGATASPLNN